MVNEPSVFEPLKFDCISFNPVALRTAKTLNFGCSECNRVHKITVTLLTQNKDKKA